MNPAGHSDADMYFTAFIILAHAVWLAVIAVMIYRWRKP